MDAEQAQNRRTPLANEVTAMPKGLNNELSLVERAERALILLAYFIELDGDMHLPLFERLEAELHELRRRQTAKDRARRLLLAYSRDGGLNAIESRNFNLSS